MSSLLKQFNFSDEWNVQLQSVGENLAKATENASMLIESSPLWIKLSIGGSLLLYVYVRQKWTALNNCGIDVLTPKIWTLGTFGQYMAEDGYINWAKEELLEKNRKSVAFYRGTTPIILTVDPDLIQSVFSSNFHAFPTRWPSGGTFGRGPIFGRTLDIISDIPSWKRLRSTLSPGFSTKQLNQMLHAIEATIDNFVAKIEKLNGNEIDVKMVAGNFATDAFTTAAFSMSMTSDTPIADFDKEPFTKAMLGVVTPNDAKVFICFMIPFGGEIMNAFGHVIYPKKSH